MSLNEQECAIHEEIEPLGEHSRQCFECSHVYPNDEAITEQYRETYPMLSELDAIDLGFCPLCLHDW